MHSEIPEQAGSWEKKMCTEKEIVLDRTEGRGGEASEHN